MTDNNANVSATAASTKKRRVRRGANTATSAVAAPADSAAAAPGRVLAPFVPSKPHSCADCEACRLRKDIAATQAAIVAAWEKQDRRAASGVGISEAARVPLPDAALEALLRSVVEGALGAGLTPRFDVATQLAMRPLATVKNAAERGVLNGSGVSFEDALRGGHHRSRGGGPRVHLVAASNDAHLRALMQSGSDGSVLVTPPAAVMPAALYAVLLELSAGAGGPPLQWIAVGCFGPDAVGIERFADGIVSPPWWRPARKSDRAAEGMGEDSRVSHTAAATSSAAAAEAFALMLLPQDVSDAVAAAAVVAERAACRRSVQRLFI